MKNYFLGGLLALGVFVPLFAKSISPDAWVLGSPIQQSNWISNTAGGCTAVLDRASCDYTGPSVALRLGYEYEFADEFWAGDQDRRFKNHCARFQEQGNYNTGDGRNGLNPGFDRTEQLKNNGYRINKNTSMVILRANSIYQINAVPSTRTPGNLYIKYVVEYANDEAANTRYQHTECYPYEISRCGDGKVDTDWFKKSPNDPAEECDEGANNGKSGSSCTIDCKKVEVKDPKCSSEYNAQTKYTETSAEWLKRTDKLCEEGNVDTFKSTRNEGQPRSFEWDCKNSEGKKTSYVCNAKQEWCGDGVYNKDHEQCDPKDSKHTNYEDGTHKTCNEKCELIDDDATCSSQYNGKNVYTSSSTHYLNGTASENLCNVGSLKQGTFGFNFVPGFPIYFQGNPYGPLQYKWLCENGQKISSNCTLNQYRCGDGHTNADKNPLSFIDGKAHYEACDPKDPNSDGKCNNDCTYAMAECGPANSTTAVYNSNYPTSRIKENELCKTGKLKEGSFSGPDSNGNYKWECKNGAKEVSCGAKDLRCGDNKYQKDYEQCDPTDPNRTNWEEGTWKTCNSNCTLTGIVRNKPVCNSYFSGVNKYTEFDSTPWVKESDYLCTQGTKDGYTYNWEGNKRVFKWTCSKDGYTVDCSASQTWCGDGIQNNGEKCDPEDGSHEGWGDGGCSPKCEPMYGPAKCGSKYNGKKEYLDINLSWLNKSTPGLCDAGTVTGFHKHMDSPIYTWQCENHGKVSNECQADQERCGDGIVQKDNEACDPENPEWKNRTDGTGCSAACEKEWCGDGIVQTYLGEECDGTKGCSSQCKLVNPPTGCNEYFTRGLRLGETKVFTDVLYAEWHDRYLYHQDVKFTENHGDYNNGVNPSFNWTDQLIKAGMKVDANSEMPIIESTPYHLITPPTVRSPNNLYVEYTIWYDNVRHEYIPSQDNLYSHKECFKYEISRCGDGVIDTGYNEVCDPGSEETKKAPDGQICNDKCEFEKVPAPVCNSKYNGQTVENLTEGPDLCSVGNYTTGSFNFNPQTNTWTWKCDNVAGVGKECSATKKVTPKGKPEIEKTLKNKVIVNAVNQKLTWTVKVTAKGGDIKDFKVRDKLPKVLKYDTFRVVKNQDNLKVSSKPSGPVESGSYNIYTWDVTGTLQEGHELIIEIDSIVVKMPTKKDDYRNIACVEDDDVVDCDDAKPGEAKILKELQNKKEVTEIGQELDWKVTVIASGGDIENIEIWDKLPIELDYVGWELDKKNTQNGITVTHDDKRSPKLSGDVNIHYWNVDGVLYSGNKITMIVKSTVKRMPASGEDILNVACVVQSGNEIDCAEDNPPKPGAKGEPEIEKTLKNKVIVNAVNQKLTWTVKVTAKGGDIKDFKVRDKLPKVLKYDTFRVVKNQDNLKVSSKPSGPVESGSNNIYTWNVTGTLHEGHELILEIDSIVVKMPTKKDDYLNVACVEDDNKIDCDDAKPGTVEILKELQNKREVTETGQELDWKVTVIASGGDIENFEIWDKLPVELDYAGWELDKANTQDKVTVTYDDNRSPKPSGDVNIHYWNVDGVLYSGNKITMIVKSTVKRMPTSGEDILNVACVVQSGNEIDCAEDNPPSSKGKPEIEKTLKNKVIVNAVNQKLTWTVKVTAKGGDIKDFKVRDKLPKVLKYDTFRVVKNQDNLKVSSKPSGPVESGSNNIYTWNVTGTLHEGHELILEIDSVVVKMPTKKDDYLNVACVEDDNKIDCDDAKPGTAEILKELQNKREVTETGQELDWKVTVIASGGDIENFEIWDKLPIELDYAGWELDKANTQDKVTVTHDDKRSPKLSGDVNIHYWNVDGILYSGNKITMIVKSTVKRMPTSGEDILNVACVVQSGNEIDCAEDNPPKPGGKLVIQKTLNPKKLVTETGEILTWDIKVTASGGAVTGGFKISDIVPYALEFTGVYKIKDNPAKLTMGKWHKGDISDLKTWKGGEFTGEVWTLDVNGGLKQNQSLVLTVTTRVVKMPKTEDDYRNVACVIKDDTQECDDDKPKQKPDLRIKKHFTDGTKSGKNVKIGDEIAYRIDFGNSGNTVASITSIKDFLPKNVKYISSKIFVEGTNSYTGSTQSGDDTIFKGFTAKEGIHIDIYGGINLQPGQTGYIILTGEVLRDFTGQRTNFACIYLNDEVIDCDDATHKIEPNEFKCEKLEVPTGDLSNGGGSKEVKCTASGGVADLITIDCGEGASGNRYITGDNKSELNGTCTYPSGANAYSLKCTVKKDGKDYTSNGCNGSVTVKGSTGPSGCFPAGTKVTMADGTKKNIEDVKVGDRVLSYNTDTNKNEGNLVLNRLVHEDNVHEMYELTINGKVLKVTDVHRFYVRKSDSSKDYDWIESKHLKVGDILLMNDGSLVKIEKINHYSNVETVYNLTVENNHNYFVDKGYLVHNSKHPGGCTSNCNPTPYCEENPDRLECNIANENCFNINVGNFSIEKTELLPLYLNVYRKNDGYNYVFKNSNDGCSPEDINLASFKCKIRILRPDDNEIAYTSNEFDCLTLGENVFTSNDNPLIKKRAGKQTDLYTIDPFDGGAGKYRPTIMVISGNKLNTKNNNGEDILGEYKFQIMVTKYDQCAVDDDGNGNGWKTITREDAPVCQNNFVLTDSYTVQKTPSGNLTASTDTLEKFKEADGDKVSFASYLKAIATSEYHPNDTVNKAMDTFIDKYKRLAVKVDISKSKFLSSQVEVKKVPGKHIYFVNGDITVKGGSNTIDTPFTIVQTSGKTIINGNVGHNMMLLTKGNIIFSGDCETNQNVKGIFYAQGDLFRDGVKKNDNLRNNVRCTQGGLNIKGVLIGKNFNNLMKDSRSHLETRFVEGNKTTKVMNGGSVVIEYSPSIFTKGTMPPGAEDFTTALSIYKN